MITMRQTIKRIVNNRLTRFFKRLPFLGGHTIYFVVIFFYRNMKRESLNLRASSIAFNLFLSLLPAFIFLFTLLPYIPVKDLNTEILSFLQKLMPASAFQSIDEILNEIFTKPSSGLLSFGLIASLWFASNGMYSLMETFNKKDTRSWVRRKLVAMGMTAVLGILFTAGICLFLLTQFMLELVVYNTHLNQGFLYYLLIFSQWIIIFFLLFGACVIIYRHGEINYRQWKQIYPGAALASVLIVLTSIIYAYYVAKWANYSKLYGSLGAMIITLFWLYFNSAVVIIGHDFNRSLAHAKKIRANMK
jgi:membrane protein